VSHIYLYGPPASGKTTIGKILAENLNLEFVDLDDRTKQAAGMEIPQLMSERGLAGFRDLESAEFERLKLGSDSVVALGGGTLLRNENRSCAESSGEIVCLDADFHTLVQRLAGDTQARPLLENNLSNKLAALLTGRGQHYASFQIHLGVEGKKPEQIAWQIQSILGRFYLRSMGAGYETIVRPGSLDSLGDLLQAHGLQNPVIVTDVNVASLHADHVLDSLRRSHYKPSLLSIPAGESAKTLDTITDLWRGFLETGLDRRSTVVALGGGVVGDMAGFAAATFMRGVDWVVVPTSLLSMVDASLGGKTGFDLPEGKNLIGSFHPPRFVLADTQVLGTLPASELRSGLAEVVKHGVIADPDLFSLCSVGLESALENLPQIVRRAMAVKIRIIEDDPYEKGSRASLNLGHTVGHAVESVSGYRLRHGEAVAIGMVAEAKLAEVLNIAPNGLSARIAEALSALGLPTQIPGDLSKDKLIHAMRFDKKKAAGVTRFALPEKIGRVRVNVEVKDLEVLFREK
jgi:shikimate kinase / 3-dehydroquinate synthase